MECKECDWVLLKNGKKVFVTITDEFHDVSLVEEYCDGEFLLYDVPKDDIIKILDE